MRTVTCLSLANAGTIATRCDDGSPAASVRASMPARQLTFVHLTHSITVLTRVAVPFRLWAHSFRSQDVGWIATSSFIRVTGEAGSDASIDSCQDHARYACRDRCVRRVACRTGCRAERITGCPGQGGRNRPALQASSSLGTSSLVIDLFPAVECSRTEHRQRYSGTSISRYPASQCRRWRSGAGCHTNGRREFYTRYPGSQTCSRRTCRSRVLVAGGSIFWQRPVTALQ